MHDATLTTLNKWYTMICDSRPGRRRRRQKRGLLELCKQYHGVHPAQKIMLHMDMSPGINRHSCRSLVRTALAAITGEPWNLNAPDAQTILSNVNAVIQTGDTILKMMSNAKRKSAEYRAGEVRS